MTKIGAHIIFGQNDEPFLEAALRSVSWVDYYCAVNTDPYGAMGKKNESTFRHVVPKEKQRLSHISFDAGKFDFSFSRNCALELADDGDYVLLIDSDDVHYPEFESLVRYGVNHGHDMLISHFWHLIGYKDLWGREPHREIVFKNGWGVQFEKGVHEKLTHPRSTPLLLPNYHYVHYGYIKPPREIFKRWVLYSEIDGDPDHYKGREPDRILDGWFEGCQPFIQEHPPAAQEVLKRYPPAPASARALEGDIPRNIGLVLLTWNDEENLRTCLKTLSLTRQPFKLVTIDNYSSDDSAQLVSTFMINNNPDGETNTYWPSPGDGFSLAQALNVGFGHFMKDDNIDYIGWIHPDMIFERDTWLECLRDCLDNNPDIVKVGCAELGTRIDPEPWAGNSQCYLVRKSALEEAGLFNDGFEACGGYEDWEHNYRLSKLGKIMIWPQALVRHNSMGTRVNHDNVEAARRNAELYYKLVGQWEPVI